MTQLRGRSALSAARRNLLFEHSLTTETPTAAPTPKPT
jgi:hypothetical protein